MTREQIQGMLTEGYDLNQIAAIHMISKQALQDILDSGACAPIIEKSKGTTGTSGKSSTSSTSGITNYGIGTSGTNWINEEGL